MPSSREISAHLKQPTSDKIVRSGVPAARAYFNAGYQTGTHSEKKPK